MKKKFMIITTVVLLQFSVGFAQDGKAVPNEISNELHREFKNVTDVQWKTTSNYYKASFTADANPIEAFYSFEGKLIGLSRKISVEQMPLSLVREVKEKWAAYSVTDLFELLTDRGTEYFITFKNEKETKTYKSSGYSWTRY